MAKIKELYEFIEGSQTWRYTSANVAEIDDGNAYSKLTIGRTEVKAGEAVSNEKFEIVVPLTSEIGQRWLLTDVDTRVSVTVFSKDIGTGAKEVEAKGRLVSIKPNGNEIALVFESAATSFRRNGLRRRFGLSCGHVHYSPVGCKLNKDDWAKYVSVSAINGTDVIIDPPDFYSPERSSTSYSLGMIEAPDGTLRFIRNHIGDTISLIRPLANLTSSFAEAALNGYGNNYGKFYSGFFVRVFPGCDRTDIACDSFNNINNNGGFKFMPNRNPINGSSIV